MSKSINELVKEIHEANVTAGWWNDTKTGEGLLKESFEPLEIDVTPFVIGTKIMLVVTELSEAIEGYRKDLMDDKLPHRKMVEVELADSMIRIMDIAGALEMDLEGAIAEKRQFNSERSDHKVENRVKTNGKKF